MGARRLEPARNWDEDQRTGKSWPKPSLLWRRSRQIYNNAQTDGQKSHGRSDSCWQGLIGIEHAAKAPGENQIEVPFTPGLMDASQEQTDVDPSDVLAPAADGVRNFPQGALISKRGRGGC